MNAAWKLKIFEWGHFALDGGAMFGVVPKVLWSKLVQADDQNRIPLGQRSLYLECDKKKVLVDLGMGCDWDDKQKLIYDLKSSPCHETLKKHCQVETSEITHIVLTHLHFDHCGYLSFREGGEWKSRFPNAEVFLLEENLKNALNPTPRESASYIPHFWTEPLKRGQLSPLPCEWMEFREILPGISVRRIDGHTRGQSLVYVNSTEDDYLFLGDLCPTQNHLKENYVMGYDLQPGLSVLEKRQILSESETKSRRLVFPHAQTISYQKLSY